MKLELNDLGALLLLAVLGFTIGFGFVMFRWMLAIHRQQQREQKIFRPLHYFFPRRSHARSRPECWIAVRSVSPEAVKLALGLDHAAPCSWEEGLTGGHEFFISPRVHGWIIVTGLASRRRAMTWMRRSFFSPH